MSFLRDSSLISAGFATGELVDRPVSELVSADVSIDESRVGDGIEGSCHRKDGREVPVEVHLGAVQGRGVSAQAFVIRDEDGEPWLIQGVIFDITERKIDEEQIAFLAYHDKLTGLPNRLLFEEMLELKPNPACSIASCYHDGNNLSAGGLIYMAPKDSQAVTVRLSIDEYEALRTFAFVTESSINEIARRALREFLVAQGRREEFDALLKKARTQYRVALGKLADL